MKIQIVAEIEGLFILDQTITAKLYPYEFSIFKENLKRYISITKPIKDYRNVAPQFYMKNGIPQIVTTKHEAYKDMEQWLIYIEAMGAFNFEVEKIHIDELEVKWICETEEEKGCIPITSLKRNREKKKADKHLCDSNLSNLVIFRKALPEAYIPFSYYRQARNFFNDNDYYFAFINYFMMLEFIFADGQFRKDTMTLKFKNSELLELCVLSALQTFENEDNKGSNYLWILQECKKRQKKLDFDGIVYLLIEYRGLLSHASNRSKPFLLDVEQLRPLALLISLICFFLCGYIQVYCCSSDDDKSKMIKQGIEELKNKKDK
jgi:hypothetical protein